MTTSTNLPLDSRLLALVEAEQDRRREVRRTDWRGRECPIPHRPGEYVEGRCVHGRPDQIIPDGSWSVWLALAGRGWGKTRTGAEAVREWSENFNRIALIAPTKGDAREIMVEGESGILAVFPRERPARYIANRYRLEFPSGAFGTIYTADEPDRLRGPQHTKLWADEVAVWKYPEAFDMAMFGLRLGSSPQAVLTTTPKPTKLIKELKARASLEEDPFGRVILSAGSTHDNAANLAPTFLSNIIGRYEGTRLGRQEIYAEVLEDVEGALWNGRMIEETRVRRIPEDVHLVRVSMGIDPATTHGEDADQTGIVVAGKGSNGHYYVLAAEGLRVSPHSWGRRALALSSEYEVDCIVPETNQGGEMVTQVLRQSSNGDRMPRLKPVHAKRGKALRAEPVVALYEQGKVHHVGVFPVLEGEQTAFTGSGAAESDDLVDGLVYALTELAGPRKVIRSY